ncbi:MAG: molybdate ABC transporter substrate-binding protein [Propionibacteriaceae bacterium]|jgi:molybdate transport system substrate-binding protein|nr:molybdate ABC transporter substrate-binding protein [Propionibacteriaceae bacterium]
MITPRPRLSWLVAGLALLLTGCATTSPDSNDTTTAADTTAAVAGTLTIFAAASLTEAMEQLEAGFSELYPDVSFEVNLDGSSTLVTQIREGAQPDLLLTADERSMLPVVAEGLAAGDSAIFASNRLTIAVPAGNPAAIASVEDLARPDLSVVICAPAVPCGNAAQKVLSATGVTFTPASEEQNVKSVVAKLRAGEADAGLVYTTDVAAAGDTLDAVALPTEAVDQALNRYPVVILRDAPNPAAAQAFEDYLLSDAGQGVLADLGFGSAT